MFLALFDLGFSLIFFIGLYFITRLAHKYLRRAFWIEFWILMGLIIGNAGDSVCFERGDGDCTVLENIAEFLMKFILTPTTILLLLNIIWRIAQKIIGKFNGNHSRH